MSSDNKEFVDSLGEVIRGLADVWPNDRDNIMTAGAAFEDVIDSMEVDGVQLEKLIHLSWEGLKHLYEEDEYFTSVKNATMQAINVIREYLVADGDIQVENFENSRIALEKALKGEGESADSIIEAEELEKDESVQEGQAKAPDEDNEKDNVTLNDLASSIMMLNEKEVSGDEIEKLTDLLQNLAVTSGNEVGLLLKEASEKAEEVLNSTEEPEEGWLNFISEKTEEAIRIQEDAEWEETSRNNEEREQSDKTTSEKQDDRQKTNPETPEDNNNVVFIIPEDAEMSMVGEYVTECTDLINDAESALLDLEEKPEDEELINTVFRSFHTIKGTSAFMGFDPISEFTHSVETLLSMVREGDLQFDMACADINLGSIDILKKLLEVVESAESGDPLPTSAAYKRMMKVLNHICEENTAPAKALEIVGEAVEPPTVQQETDTEDTSAGTNGTTDAAAVKNGTPDRIGQKQEAESTVRVNVSRLDRLIDMVGELVIAHSVVAQDSSISKDADLMKKVNHTSKILRELQDTSLILRMVPLKATFHKMNRLVRDLSRKAGKKVNFSTMGEDTEIDRNMVDVINEPLVHMLRNSLDHGIEDPKTREKNGKAPEANIWLRAYQEGGKVVIEIEDDGKGINKERVLQKAIEKNLVDPDDKLTDSEIYGLIFLPGFSSAEKVTDLSGRGVGMDVVRRSIEQLQGKVEVSSEEGKGTKVSLEIPFTLAITDGMLVKVGDQRFIIPTINIDMTFRAEEDNLYTMMGDSEQVSFRGESVPIIRLHKLFNIDGAIEDLCEGTMLVIKNNNRRYALLLDEVVGQQQLVGKSINMMAKMPHISGGAILGDGRVGLILDTAAVVQPAKAAS